jgi:hypothetical protein
MDRPSKFAERHHEVDFCVVGGGMAGLTAALAAARRGATVLLMHDRPVLGGNASSECRVHICGADRHNRLHNLRETGILEELRMENLYRNPNRIYSIWDTILYEKCRYQDRLTLLLNCSCIEAAMDGRRIASVTGWQLTTQTRHTVAARIFADCSGDGVLAPLSGAPFRIGREARSEYDEPSAPPEADRRTMGMSLLFQSRQYDTPQPFEPPEWAYRFERCEEIPYGARGHAYWGMGYWWVELGGEQDAIHDTEQVRDELLKVSYGLWDHIKNRCPEHSGAAANWALDWMQFLPAKRESRRYVGAHVLTQNDLLAEGRFDDLVAYGGWAMDDHPPVGFWGPKRGSKKPSAVFHETPSPYGIPYRSLYSKDVANLLFAGRCHSATHMAMSSTRVMGTCCSMGQAVGTAAAMAARLGADPAGVGEHVEELQQSLLADDCYLPWVPQRFGPITASARLEASRGDPEPLRDGTNRPVGAESHAWRHAVGDHVALLPARPAEIDRVTLLLDSALHKDPQMSHHRPPGSHLTAPPVEMPRHLAVDVLAGGQWRMLREVADNHQRLLRVPVGRTVEGVRYRLLATWGECDAANLYALYVD